MNNKKILQTIKKSNLGGRGGANFPVYLKWEYLQNELKKQKNTAYLIINASEGEPNLIKDGYILANYFKEICFGLSLALKFFNDEKIKKIYCFIREDYYKKNKNYFNRVLKNKEFTNVAKKLVFYVKPDKNDYIAGEESALINIIEGKPARPRLKPPFPLEKGLNNLPSLVHNVETWFELGNIYLNRYENKRFVYISGNVKNPNVFYLAKNKKIKDILKETNNWPNFRFFTQIGGDACGELLLDENLNRSVSGSGSITVLPLKASAVKASLESWLKFHAEQSCGQCIPCREGSYRLLEMFNENNFNSKDLTDIIFSLKYTSFCAFGVQLGNLLDNFFVSIYPNFKDKPFLNIIIKEKNK